MSTPDRSVDALRQHATQRSHDARRRIEKALRELRKTQSRISVNPIARVRRDARHAGRSDPDVPPGRDSADRDRLPLVLAVVGVRSLVTRRRLAPMLLAAALFAVLLVVVVLHVVYWQHARPGLYLALASAPLMPVLTAALAVWALSRRRWALGALLLGQAVVFASSYLGALGSVTYAESGIDNILTLTYWACLAALVAAVLSPRRGEPAPAVATEVAA